MSSHEFWAELTPNAQLRKIVALSAIVAAVAGSALIIQFSIHALWRAVLVACWCGHCGRELYIRARAAARVTRIRVDHKRQVQIIGPGGLREPVILLAGSLVLARLAWLRIRFDDRVIYAELLCGDAAEDLQWHRFQLIWRQMR